MIKYLIKFININNGCIKYAILVVIGVQLIYLIPVILFWPGMMSSDSHYTIEEALGTKTITNAIPVFNVILTKALISNSGNYYGLITQILLVSAGTGYAYFIFNKYIFNYFSKINIILFILLPFTPPTGILNLTIWKDVYFSWLSLIQLVSILPIILGKNQNYSLILVSIFSGGIATLFRHNGITLNLTLILIMLFFLSNLRLRIKTIIFLIFTIIIGGNSLLIKQYIQQDEEFNLKAEIEDRMYLYDFINSFSYDLSYKMNLTNDSIMQLKKMNFFEKISISKTRGAYVTRHRMGMAGFNWKKYNNNVIDIAKIELHRNYLPWIETKFRYSLDLMGVGIVRLPPEKEVIVGDLKNVKVSHIEKFAKGRKILRTIYAEYGNYTKYIWSQFIVILSGLLVLCAYTMSIFFKKYNVELMAYRLGYLMILIAIIFLTIPILLITPSNDFRFFWPNHLFSYLWILLLINNIINIYISNE